MKDSDSSGTVLRQEAGVASSFTPGPWVRDQYGNINDASGERIVASGLALVSGYRDAGDAAFANARLIAAAPEMLDMLIKAADTFADTATLFRILGKDLGAKGCGIAEEHCRAVIAKATGKP